MKVVVINRRLRLRADLPPGPILRDGREMRVPPLELRVGDLISGLRSEATPEDLERRVGKLVPITKIEVLE